MSASRPHRREGEVVHWQGLHCGMMIDRPVEGVVVLKIWGSDVGEFGDAPMREIERHLREDSPVELFIDAWETAGASIEVSGAWARWLDRHRSRCTRIVMLAGSRYIRVTANFVRRFAGLDALMEVVSDPRAFDRRLAGRLDDAAGTV